MEKSQDDQPKRSRSLKELFKIYGSGFFVACLIMVVAYQFVEPAPQKSFSIATASVDGAYYAFAEQYRQILEKEKIELKIVETSGSVENLQLLEDNKVEVAFVQGGVRGKGAYPDLQGLASLYLEPLWIFVKKDLNVTTISDLAGRRVAIGPVGSGTRQIAMQLFTDNDMTSPGKFESLPLGGTEGAKELLAQNIDALFLVTSSKSSLVRQLFLDPSVELVNLERAESYARLHKYLSHIILPEGVLDMVHNVPDRDIHLVAPAATLVKNEELHPALTDLLMQVTAIVHKDNSILTSEKTFPSAQKLDFPVSKEAERFFRNGPPFLQRYLPFWAASLIDRLKLMILPLVALILPLTKVLPPTYRWRIRSRIYRWYEELHELDVYAWENANNEVINSTIASLNVMEHDVRLVEVPLSYAEELYNLRLHIELLRNQLGRLLDNNDSLKAE